MENGCRRSNHSNTRPSVPPRDKKSQGNHGMAKEDQVNTTKSPTQIDLKIKRKEKTKRQEQPERTKESQSSSKVKYQNSYQESGLDPRLAEMGRGRGVQNITI